MSPRPLLPLLTGLAVVAFCAPAGAVGIAQNGPGWMSSLNVPAAWSYSKGAGVTVAVLSTGVDATHPALAGAVTGGPDFTQSGRVADGPFWGAEGTAVASLITGQSGIAPSARTLSIRVTLEYNDPLNGDTTVAHRLPDAIASGIRYAVAHGAKVIDLPLDPGSLGLNGAGQRTGDPSAAGGSAAEQSAVAFALGRGVVMVAPGGDVTGTSEEFPAAYHGVIAVGATGAAGTGVAPYSNHASFVALTAPGTALTVASPPRGFTTLSTTDNAAALVAGIAALIRSRYPGLTTDQVTTALERSTGSASRGPAGTGFGFVNAGRALRAAAAIAPAPRAASSPAASSHRSPTRTTVLSPDNSNAETLASTALRDAVFAAGFLIVVFGAILLAGRARRRPRRGAGAANGRHTSASGRKSHRGGAPAIPASDAPHAGPWLGARRTPARPLTSRGPESLGVNAQRRGQRPALEPVPKTGTARRLAIGRGGLPDQPPWEPAPPPPALPPPALLPSPAPTLARLPEPGPYPEADPFMDPTGPATGLTDFLPSAGPSVRAVPDVPAGPPRHASERFAAAPIPPDLPGWGTD